MRYLLIVFLLFSLPVMAQEVNELAPNNVAKNTMQISPQARQKLMDKFQNMTPQQRQAITNQGIGAWQGMSQENKDTLKAKALEQYQALTPQQKQQMQQQAMQKWQSLTPEQKSQMTSQFQSLLQGGLQQ